MITSECKEPASIKLPQTFGSRCLSDVFRVCRLVRESKGPVVLDATDTEFFDPLGIAVLGALLEPISADRPVAVHWLRVDVASYLSRMDVIEHCRIGGVETRDGVRHDLRESLVELTKVSKESDVDDAAHRLATAMAGTLNLANPDRVDAFRYPLQYSLSELLLNALSHAKREGRFDAAVWVAAQYYKTTGKLQLAVVDNGCGFLGSLKNSPALKQKTHLDAIPTALLPFVSCNPDIGLPGGTANRGVGLTTTHRIARATRGDLLIVSGNASAKADTAVQSTLMSEGAFWEGVAIQMTCRRSGLPSVKVPALLPVAQDAPDLDLNFVD